MYLKIAGNLMQAEILDDLRNKEKQNRKELMHKEFI